MHVLIMVLEITVRWKIVVEVVVLEESEGHVHKHFDHVMEHV